MGKALIVVDVQVDFCEGGALGVEGGNRVAAEVAELLAGDHGYDAVVATRDHHIDPGAHFSDQPDFVDTWPVHCVAGTPGAEYDPGLDVSAVTHHVKKGQGIPAYSLFEGTTDAGEKVADLLTAHGVIEVDVTGIATDYCVRASALDAVEHGIHVRILTGLVAGVAPESSQAALAELAHLGAELVDAP